MGHQPLCVKHLANISRGSVVTYLRCGRMFNDNFIINELSFEVRNFENWPAFGKVIGNCVTASFWRAAATGPLFMCHTVACGHGIWWMQHQPNNNPDITGILYVSSSFCRISDGLFSIPVQPCRALCSREILPKLRRPREQRLPISE